jgi:hypothetical protein
MSWHHRVIKHTSGIGETYYGVHEVYHGLDKDHPDALAWTDEPVRVMGDTIDDLRWTLTKMLEALDRPVIDAETTEGVDLSPREVQRAKARRVIDLLNRWMEDDAAEQERSLEKFKRLLDEDRPGQRKHFPEDE